MTEPKPFDVMRARFDGRQWIQRGGVTTEGAEPEWHRDDWPCVRGDEFGPPIAEHAALAKQSKAARR